jgi:hypothetical protein
MLGKFKAWFTALSTAGKVGVIAAASIVGLAAASPNTSNTNKPAPHVTPQTKTSCQASVSYSTETQPVAFTSSTVNDDTLAKGQTKVTTTGVNGEKELQHKHTKYTPQGCKPDTDETVSQKVTKDPVNQVTAIGTYVAPAPAPATSASCYPLTNGGNCYEAGEYCRNSDHGVSGVAGNGESIICAYNNGWRWEPN